MSIYVCCCPRVARGVPLNAGEKTTGIQNSYKAEGRILSLAHTLEPTSKRHRPNRSEGRTAAAGDASFLASQEHEGG
jgi:hypothetical protein